jgi:hypothetical protein
MAEQTFGAKVKRTGMRILLILLLIVAGVFAYLYWGNIEKGNDGW